MFRKLLILHMLALFFWPCVASALVSKPTDDSRELQLQEMLILFLLPDMRETLGEEYSKHLKTTPDLFPYYIDIEHVERLNGFRGYDFLITLEATPTVGPHIVVGKDRFIFEISPTVNVKLLKFEHIKGPDRNDFPSNYLYLLK
ncbi:DUF3888 domain-containing protein [Cohnella zeiphila]|nr:DUF3888 domain-containing protein [Cohnella zeiphila]